MKEMKATLKVLTGILFLPILLIGGIIAVVKTIVVMTIVFAWQKGDDWHDELMMKLHNYMQWIKGGEQ
jgi:uncharacterized protein involved in cysteine biosynthesis